MGNHSDGIMGKFENTRAYTRDTKGRKILRTEYFVFVISFVTLTSSPYFAFYCQVFDPLRFVFDSSDRFGFVT